MLLRTTVCTSLWWKAEFIKSTIAINQSINQHFLFLNVHFTVGLARIKELHPLKNVAREKWDTHDALWVQWPGNEVAKVHHQLRSLKIWIAAFLNGSCKISLCVCLETMEIQLEQLALLESSEMLFSSVKSKGCICISTEREVFIRILTTWSRATLYDKKNNKIDVRPMESSNLSIFVNGNSYVVLVFNVLSSHLFAWRVGFVLEAFFNALRSPDMLGDFEICPRWNSIFKVSACFWF